MWGLNYYAVFVLGAMFIGDGVAGYTLRITSANASFSGTSDDGIIFSFCEGGSYCTPGDDDEVLLPPDSGIGVDGGEISIPVSLGYEPTTMLTTKSSGDSDAWHFADVVWEDGDDLLGRDGSIALESQTGTSGCDDGVSDDIVCLGQWRFFNLNGDSNYMYDVRVLPCSGTGGATIKAHFCSHASCDGTAGEEVDVFLTTSSEDDSGWTLTQFSSDFNPVAMRLSEVDANWCAMGMTFNLFDMGKGLNVTAFDNTVNGTACKIINNLQYNGLTSTTIAPTTAPAQSNDDGDDSVWLDAAWEVTVTVIGAGVTATAAAADSSDRIFTQEKNVRSRSLEKVIVGNLPPFLHYREDTQVSEGQTERNSVIALYPKMFNNGLDWFVTAPEDNRQS